MKVSVVVPTYSPDRYDDFVECVESVLAQTYDDVEVVVIVDGNEAVYEQANADYGDRDDVVVYGNAENAGPLRRANMGAVQASGEVVVITDDDAVADERWIAELVTAYEDDDAIAAGGRVDPEWVAGKPEFLPEEFYWLIGVTHRGFPEEEQEVRNTWGANLSFRRDAFFEVGGIKIGGIDPDEVQGRETEFCARLAAEFGKGVHYKPDAVVYHKIYEYRTGRRWLLSRAFWQGYSKRAMEVLVPDSSGEETDFLARLLGEFIPGRGKRLLTDPSKTAAVQLWWLLALTATVGLGYLYGLVKWR